MGSTDTDRLVRPDEAARRLGVDPRTVSVWARQGKLTSIKTPGGHHRFRESEINALATPGEHQYNWNPVIIAVLATQTPDPEMKAQAYRDLHKAQRRLIAEIRGNEERMAH